MKNINISLIASFALAAVIAITGTASAQRSASTSATASAKIVSGIAVKKVQDLNFGQVVRSATAGVVVLDPATAERRFSGGVTVGQNGGNAFAQFTATGEGLYAYNLTLPDGISITTADGKASMKVTEFTSTLAKNSSVLSKDGSEDFNVGGTLNVDANQQTGSYTGEFNVTVSYQ